MMWLDEFDEAAFMYPAPCALKRSCYVCELSCVKIAWQRQVATGSGGSCDGRYIVGMCSTSTPENIFGVGRGGT